MACINICVLASDMLQGFIVGNIHSSTITLNKPNMDGLQPAINARLEIRKSVTVLDGLRELGGDVSMWSQWNFLLYQGSDTVYMSFVKPTEDGVSRAQ